MKTKFRFISYAFYLHCSLLFVCLHAKGQVAGLNTNNSPQHINEINSTGLDKVVVINDPFTNNFNNKLSDTTCTDEPPAISVNLNHTVKKINSGQYGINITGMFTKPTLYEGPHSADQWQWLSDLRPNSLRFPGGSSSKFMHVLNGDKGYGYDMVEITRYLDASDDVLEAPNLVENILSVEDDATLLSWFDNSYDILNVFKEYKTDYLQQELLAPGDLYINQFIRLIKKIEDENPGHRVDVILCLNIISETAEDCKAIVDYLQSNPIYNVNVVGVEMGNEPTSKFWKKIVLFDTFEDFWAYLDGKPLPAQLDRNEAIGEDLFLSPTDHEFFEAFKNKGGFNCKVALSAGRWQDTADIKIGGPRTDPNWNYDLFSHFGDVFEGTNIHKFHAIVFHNYYEKDSWYNECVVPYLEDNYDCPEWEFETMDARLQASFEAARKNFRRFVATDYVENFGTFNDIYQFYSNSPDKKELWITEWNLKDEGTDDKGKIYTNTFMHSFLLQEWWLQCIKMNFQTGYRENFFTYNTIQNYAGGAQVQLLTPAEEATELAILGKNYPPYNLEQEDTAKRNYYVKRSTMFTVELLSEIYKNDLDYFPANIITYAHNMNMQPTFFIDKKKSYIYMYYTNSQCSDQQYILNPGGMEPLFLSPVTLNDATIYTLDATQLYSTSGKSMLYGINQCYDSINPYTIELNQTDTFSNPICDAPEGSFCVQVPGYSAGYVKIHIKKTPHEREGISGSDNIIIYPNPANNYLHIDGDVKIYSFEIYSMVGAKLFSSQFNSGIDINFLPSGMYQVVLLLEDGTEVVKQFVKS